MKRGLYWFRSRVAALLPVVLLALACGGEERDAPQPRPAPAPPPPATPAPPPAPSADPTAEAAQVFETRCVTCHGPQGAGDGPASAGLTPAPRNFADPEWQGSVSDEHIEKIILFGGAAVERSPAMPPNPDLGDKPEVVAALRAYVRKLGSN